LEATFDYRTSRKIRDDKGKSISGKKFSEGEEGDFDATPGSFPVDLPSPGIDLEPETPDRWHM
jgi:hypothetical protein